MTRFGCLLLATAALACSLPPPTVTVRVELPVELELDAKQLEVHPRVAETARETARGVVVLRLRLGSVRLSAPGACPKQLDTSTLARERVHHVTLAPLFDVGPKERVVGLASDFVIEAHPGCAEARSARAALTISGGAPLADVKLSPDARRLSAKTTAAPPVPPGSGVVAISANLQRALRTELTLRVEHAGTEITRTLGVSPVARSTGLPNFGLSQPILLAPGEFRLERQPSGSRAVLRSAGQFQELVTDVAGQYRLRDGAGRELTLHSERFDRLPLDCGRSDCHAAVTASARHSAMTEALASDLGGCHTLERPECATACHTTGEPGIADGGFHHVATTLGLPALPAEYEDLPAPLQRLGGVGCLACHGPTARPEPSARWAIVRSEVCAVCHDAPPRYGHFQAFATSRMAHGSGDARAQEDAACARCHSAWGALGRPAPPRELARGGLTCATCHAVHAPGRDGVSHGLLRDFPLPASIGEPPASFLGKSRVCISCHAPSGAGSAPEASAAVLVAGRGGLEPETGEPLELSSPHASHARGCLVCHDGGPAQLVLGKTHGFQAAASACARCHEVAPPRDPSIAARAQSLLARLEPAAARAAPHQHDASVLAPPALARAVYDVRLVLEDPAADVHHPRYARALLDAAERLAPRTAP